MRVINNRDNRILKMFILGSVNSHTYKKKTVVRYTNYTHSIDSSFCNIVIHRVQTLCILYINCTFIFLGC